MRADRGLGGRVGRRDEGEGPLGFRKERWKDKVFLCREISVIINMNYKYL